MPREMIKDRFEIGGPEGRGHLPHGTGMLLSETHLLISRRPFSALAIPVSPAIVIIVVAALCARDLPRLRRMIEAWPASGWERQDITSSYRRVLLRAISTSHFLRRAIGGNQ